MVTTKFTLEIISGLAAVLISVVTYFVVRQRLNWRYSTFQAPAAECSRESGSLASPVQQTSFDIGEMVV